MAFNASTGLDAVPGLESYTRVYTVYQCNPQVALVDGTYPVAADVPVEYQGTPYYKGDVYSKWKFVELSTGATHKMADHEPYVVSSADPSFRENDPYYTNILAALRPQREMVAALELYAHQAYTNGSLIGIYDHVPLTYRNINRILNNVAGDYNVWCKNQEKIALAKVWNGLSMVDVINGFGGNFYFTAYVPTSAFDTNSFTRGRFRRYVKRQMSFYEGLGMNAVPLLYPFYVNTASTPVSATLIQGIIDDVEAYQAGRWGVWADVALVNTTQWAAFVAIVNG